MPLDERAVVGVVGAGAMGSGIAQVAAVAGHEVVVADAHAPTIQKAEAGLTKALAREVEKGRMSEVDRAAALARVTYVPAVDNAAMQAFTRCDLVIEAITEELGAKQELFSRLEAVMRPGGTLATNTSSLSIAAIAARCARPERVVGVHFFNPAPVMPLVEIVGGLVTDPEVTAAARALVDAWGKTTVLCSDTPGFIVNRVARPFYGEAIRIFEEGIADRPTIDWAMTALGGFRMGPFELMDFIGNDVNFAVTSSIYAAFFHDPRYRPSLTQQRLVQAGLLGRKSGRGHYDHRQGAERPAATMDEALGRGVLDRILAMLTNEAADAVHWQVASPADVDLAMTKGVNYPRGLLAWGDELGWDGVLARMLALQDEYGEDRYRPSPLVRYLAREGKQVFA